jgi:hypothetical protein
MSLGAKPPYERVRILPVPGSTRRRATNLAAMRTAHEPQRDEMSTHLATGAPTAAVSS